MATSHDHIFKGKGSTVSKHPFYQYTFYLVHAISNWYWVVMLFLITLFFSFLTITPHQAVLAADVFVTGSNTLEITDYSIVRRGIVSGNYIQSDIFTVGSYQWTIEFYPQGTNSSYSDFISIMVRLMNPRNAVRAIFTHRLRDWSTSAWSTNTPATSDVNTFSPSGYTSWGYYSFMRRSVLEASNYLRNDTLVIKTTLWVVNSSSTVVVLPRSDVADISTGGGYNSN